MVLTILIVISSLAFVPLWRVATDQVFARMPQVRRLSATAIDVLRWFAIAIDGAQGLLLGAAGLWLSAQIGLAPFRVLLRPWRELRAQLRPLLVRSLWLGGALFLISGTVVLSQLIVVGLKPPAGVSSSAVSKHQEVIQVMTRAMSARGAIALALGAPIFEEVEFRLFLLSLIAWLWVRRKPSQSGSLTRAALWTAIIISGFAFGLAHVLSEQSVGWWRPWYVQILTDPRLCRNHFGIRVLALGFGSLDRCACGVEYTGALRGADRDARGLNRSLANYASMHRQVFRRIV